MLKSLRQVLIVFKKYRGRLVLSQVLVLISALGTVAVASLSQQLINDGIEAGDIVTVLGIGLKMLVWAAIGGGALAGAAWLAVFFSQGTAYVIRAYLYRKIQTFSFGNFDRFRTGNLLVRLNADVVNIQNAVLYATLLVLYAPFMLIVAFILTLNSTPEMVWLLVVIVAFVLVLMWFIAPRIFKAYDERQKKLDNINNTLQEKSGRCAGGQSLCPRRLRDSALRRARPGNAKTGFQCRLPDRLYGAHAYRYCSDRDRLGTPVWWTAGHRGYRDQRRAIGGFHAVPRHGDRSAGHAGDCDPFCLAW